MTFNFSDILAGLFATLFVYELFPVLLVVLHAQLKIGYIRIVSILNYLFGAILFSYYNYIATGTVHFAAGTALFWTLIGYGLMCKYCKKEDIRSKNSIPDEQLPNNIVNFKNKETVSDKNVSKNITKYNKSNKTKMHYGLIICIAIIIALFLYSCYSTFYLYVNKSALSVLADKYNELEDENSRLQSEFNNLYEKYNNLQNAYDAVYDKYSKYLDGYMDSDVLFH